MSKDGFRTVVVALLIVFTVSSFSGATPDPQRSAYGPLGTVKSNNVAVFTGTADHELLSAAGVGFRNYITELSIGNGAGAEGTVTIKDGSTTLRQFRIFGDSSAYLTFPAPLRGSTNTAINVATDNGSQSLNVGASGFTSEE